MRQPTTTSTTMSECPRCNGAIVIRWDESVCINCGHVVYDPSLDGYQYRVPGVGLGPQRPGRPRKRPPWMKPRDCKRCGVEFLRMHQAQMYCSVNCRIAGSNERRLVTILPRACKKCGREYTPKQTSGLFCTKQCNTEYHGRLRRRPKPLPRKCVVCGAEFQPIKRHRIFCSMKCRTSRAYRRKQKEKVA